MFNFFKKDRGKQLYPELKPGERIVKLIKEFLEPELSKEGFVFFKSKMQFTKLHDIFEYDIYFSRSKYNSGNQCVRFDVLLSVSSPKYASWEKEFYELPKKQNGFISSGNPEFKRNGDKQFYESGWYDLAKQHNEKLMNVVLKNLKTAGLAYFNNYRDIDTAIHSLMEYPIANIQTITDFYIMTGRIDEAKVFFENNKAWHEEQISKEDGYFMANQYEPFKLRENKLAQL